MKPTDREFLDRYFKPIHPKKANGSAMCCLSIIAIIRETEKAWLLLIGDNEQWFPKSQVFVKGKMLLIPNWILQKREEERKLVK